MASLFADTINVVRDICSTTHEIKQRRELSELCGAAKLGAVITAIVGVALYALIGGAAGVIIASIFIIPAYDTYKIADRVQLIADDGWENFTNSILMKL